MERYFIELMVDQIQKGNKQRQTFTKSAWNEMTELLNQRFSLQLDGDIFKNQHKTFQRQWLVFKDIIEQSGFSWDPDKQMVTAEDPIWYAYIMAQPKAKNYRRQRQPDYLALCTIFQETNADGMYNCTGIDIDERHQEFTPPKDEGVESQEQQMQPERSRTNWTLAMERYFIELMLDKGNKRDKSFTRAAWKEMIKLLNQKFNLQLDKDILQNRHKKL